MGFFDTVKDGVSGAVDKVKDAGAAAKEDALDAAEVAALISFGVIPFLATWLQEQRKAFGLPRIDNPGYFAIFAITIVIVSGLIIGFVYTLIFKFINLFYTFCILINLIHLIGLNSSKKIIKLNG